MFSPRQGRTMQKTDRSLQSGECRSHGIYSPDAQAVCTDAHCVCTDRQGGCTDAAHERKRQKRHGTKARIVSAEQKKNSCNLVARYIILSLRAKRKYRKPGKTHETEICHNLPAAVVVHSHDSGLCISTPSPRQPHLHAPEHDEPSRGDLRQRLRVALQRACARKGAQQGQGSGTAQYTPAAGCHNTADYTTDYIFHTRENSRAPRCAGADAALHARADATGPACGVTRRGTEGSALSPQHHHF